MFHVALFEPEIAGNTGSAARTCLATGARLHIIRPIGFKLSDEALKRAGMDYWHEVDVTVHASFDHFAAAFQTSFTENRVFSLTTKAAKNYSEAEFRKNDVLLFGPESRGLPEPIRGKTSPLRIPMMQSARSLNLAVSVAVTVYEAWRQLEFRSVY
ncbi:MAG: tRNA (cytidine(34)-2'-O)-methyltransferase [Trueperaceae bacterium]|nr:tRNA (cytidine(34)-2'-O)-methyltransferase [Trueperaceae bacterium]